MKARNVKRQVQNKPFMRASNQPIVINTSSNKTVRPRGGCCGKKRT
ncbi:hypothetical protein VKA52_00345 [Halobacillus sp. HZG1]|nr:hypothetical protein [Halobacillus sp. HZG1]MEC3882181.1 hypothetical protein [Halobacillus sp. HZG1]